MNIAVIIQIAIGAVLVNNFILARMLGLCPAFCISMKVSGAVGMGIIVTFVMGIAAACTWIINAAVLIPLDMASFQLIVFIVIIATVVQLTEMLVQKFSPKLNDFLGMNLSLITTDCAVLAAALITTQENPFTGQPFTFPEACVSGVASGVGFALVIILMAGIREKLELGHGWKSLRGLPQALIVAGLMAMAFLGFTGMHFSAGGGG